MIRNFISALQSRTFWDGFLYGLSGPMMMVVEPPRGPGFSPLPDLRRPRLSSEDALEQVFCDIENALREAFDHFEELQPFGPAQAQIAVRR